jgi:hypothetical protein
MTTTKMMSMKRVFFLSPAYLNDECFRSECLVFIFFLSPNHFQPFP